MYILVGVQSGSTILAHSLATPTKIYMTGSIRSWIHYIDLRSAHGTQKEHMDIVENCRTIFKKEFPIVSEALSW